jgi:hypothetical protein
MFFAVTSSGTNTTKTHRAADHTFGPVFSVRRVRFTSLKGGEFSTGVVGKFQQALTIWGLGPVLLIPTATASVLGTDKWGAGPSVVALVQPEGWTIGVITNNVWSFAGGNNTRVNTTGLPQRFVNGTDEFIDRGTKVNSFMLQYFVNRNFEKGWYLTSSPILTANWELPSDERWIVPFGGGIGRVFKMGHQPVNVQVQNFYNAIHPKTLPHPQWQFRAEFTLLFPEK